jgi:tetratricopeptide (TPR) repeat protein
MATVDRDSPLCLGRDAELERLRESLASALAGQGGLVLLTGDPGIGKTRLAEACASEAERAGATVLWGRCWEAGGAPAYWPWIEVLRALAAERGAEALAAGGAAPAREAARLVPELAPAGADAAPAPGADPAERARFALFDGVAQLLLAAAREGPLVLALEDLHAADPASLLLLELLAPRLRPAALLVLATWRVGDPGTDPAVERLLAGLARRGEQLALTGLDLDSTGRLAAASAGAELPEETVDELLRRTEGNPFFVQALAGALGDEAGLPSPLTLPAGVREAIGRRVEPLSPGTRATLAAAAVLGRDFAVARVARLRGISPDEALGLLDAAVRAGLVAPTGPEGELRFAHELIRDWLYGELDPSARAELHRREADALEPEAARDAELQQELAHHRVAAIPVAGAGPALAACERAALHALALLAFEDAAALYERALAVADRALEPLEPARRAALLLALGEARIRGGDAGAARDAFARAANVARAAGMPRELARAALGFGRLVVRPGEIDETLVALLEQALELVPEDEHGLRARLLARLARELHFGPDPSRPRALAAEAVTLADADGGPGVRAYALLAWHVARSVPDTVEERIDAATGIIELARDAGDLEQELEGHVLRAVDLLELGRPDAAAGELDSAERIAARLRQPGLTWSVLLVRATLALLAGRFDDAERLIADAYAVGRRSRGRGAFRYRVLQQIELHYLRGGYADLGDDVRALAAEAPEAWGFALPHLLAMTGRLDDARPAFERLAVHGFGGPVDDMAALSILSRAAELCAQLEDAARAAQLYELLLPYADRWIVAGAAGGLCTGTVRARLGALAATMGRFEEAASHLEAAVRAHREAGAAPMTAITELELARVLRALGDEARADELLGHALRTARALGMAPLVERIEAAPPAGAAPAAHASLRLEGEYWTASFAGRDVRLRDRKGLAYLARLVEHPHREIAALELAGGPEAPAGDAGAVLDEEAKRDYRRRMAELREELDEAERWNDPERAERAAAELDFVAAELSRAVGLGGRDRRAASSAERARVSVTRAIRSAMASVEERHPELGRHLAAAVRTGTYCRYAPPAGDEVAWRVQRG